MSHVHPHLTAWIDGVPRPQGSLTMVTARFAKYSDTTIAHRNHVVAELRQEWGEKAPLTGALSLVAVFHMPRPKSHFGTGRNAATLKTSAPQWPTGAPDADKCLRLLGDALKLAGVIKDDALIVHIAATKRYADDDIAPGTFLSVADAITTT